MSLTTTDNMPERLSRNRNFILLWCAYAISALGDHLSEMAILQTQDALHEGVDITPLMARMTFVFFVAFVLFSPIAGMASDRWSRRAIMIGADVARCAIFVFFASLIAWTQDWGRWGPFLPLLPIGFFAAFFSPARASLLPNIVRPSQLIRANGLISGLGIIATMAAAGLGGYLADNYSSIISFRADAFTYLMSAVCLVLMVTPATTTHRRASGAENRRRTSLRDGLRYVRTHRRVWQLILISMLVWFCGPLVNSVIPAIARDVYGGTYQTMSIYKALMGGGFVLGAIIVATLGETLRSHVGVMGGLLGISLSMTIFASSVFIPFSTTWAQTVGGVGVLLGGMSAIIAMASYNALLQRIVPDRYRGRVFGVRDVSTAAALLLATGLLGIPSWTNVDRWVGWILLGVALLTLIAFVAILASHIRRSGLGLELYFLEEFNDLFCRFYWRLRVVGRHWIPPTGAFIFTSNHGAAPDPCFLVAAVRRRRVSFIIAREYVKWPIIGYLARVADSMPVRRDGRDTAATKHALRKLNRGEVLGIFIEGGIRKPGTDKRPKDGVAMLALRTGAPVIPAFINGTTYYENAVIGLLARYRARLRVGPPVDLDDLRVPKPSREMIREATMRIYRAVYDLGPEHERPPVLQPNAPPDETTAEQDE